MYGPTPPVPAPAQPTPPYPEPGPYAGYAPQGAGYPGHPTTPGGYPAHPGTAAPGPYPPFAPHQPSTAARVGLFALRTVLACVPIGTIGILSWIPLLRTVFVRRRVRDWVALGTSALLSSAAFVTVGSSADKDKVQAAVGMVGLAVAGVGSTVYFLVAELRARPPAQPVPLPQPYAQPLPYAPPWQAVTPAPAPGPAPDSTPAPALVPLGQVQAELDELSALLRRHERPAP